MNNDLEARGARPLPARASGARVGCFLAVILLSLAPLRADSGYAAPGMSNPIIPGYFADPSIVHHDGRYYLYATIDPWGDDTLGCWESEDFKNWRIRALNWPTKQQCTSPTSGGSKVWAPSVVRGKDGKFYMYVSVGSEVWVGVADEPLGTWKNALDTNRPLIERNFRPGFHMIDAEAFIDDDGKAYLYWGSGLNWVNGRCWVVQLNDDMTSFASEVKDVTPANYFEGPVMLKRGGKYYLMYSNGNTTKDTYQVHYAVGDNPMGPFKEGKNSPILKTDKSRDVISPGHHTVLEKDGQVYIVYHRAALPLGKQTNRQVCVDLVKFAADGSIEPVTPTHDGARALREPAGQEPAGDGSVKPRLAATASSSRGAEYGPERMTDDNLATLWKPDPAAGAGAGPWAQIDLGSARDVKRVWVLPEFAARPHGLTVQLSEDGKKWETVVGTGENGASGSPLTFPITGRGRYVRVNFVPGAKADAVGLWEFGAE